MSDRHRHDRAVAEEELTQASRQALLTRGALDRFDVIGITVGEIGLDAHTNILVHRRRATLSNAANSRPDQTVVTAFRD